jgi:hypothetical protein
MNSVNIRSTKPDRYAQAPQQQPHACRYRPAKIRTS